MNITRLGVSKTKSSELEVSSDSLIAWLSKWTCTLIAFRVRRHDMLTFHSFTLLIPRLEGIERTQLS